MKKRLGRLAAQSAYLEIAVVFDVLRIQVVSLGAVFVYATVRSSGIIVESAIKWAG